MQQGSGQDKVGSFVLSVHSIEKGKQHLSRVGVSGWLNYFNMTFVV